MIEITLPAPGEPQITFPCYAKAKSSAQVVLFCNPTTGIEVRNTSGGPSTRTNADGWQPITDDSWEILPKGTVITSVQP